MKPMDFSRFKRWIARNGYSVGRSKKHHVILDAEGKVVAWFAVSHKKGGKAYVKGVYVAHIQQTLGLEEER
jgi:hypothetical protein